LTFLHNHRQAIAAFDFFTVPTLGFPTFCCFFVIEHRRRRILAFNSAAHPSADWIVQQLRFAFSNPYPYRDVVFDRVAKFRKDFVEFLRSARLRLLRSSFPKAIVRHRVQLPASCVTQIEGVPDSKSLRILLYVVGSQQLPTDDLCAALDVDVRSKRIPWSEIAETESDPARRDALGTSCGRKRS
jgi:hypothetical protein